MLRIVKADALIRLTPSRHILAAEGHAEDGAPTFATVIGRAGAPIQDAITAGARYDLNYFALQRREEFPIAVSAVQGHAPIQFRRCVQAQPQDLLDGDLHRRLSRLESPDIDRRREAAAALRRPGGDRIRQPNDDAMP